MFLSKVTPASLHSVTGSFQPHYNLVWFGLGLAGRQSHYVAIAGLELREISLPLPPEDSEEDEERAPLPWQLYYNLMEPAVCIQLLVN